MPRALADKVSAIIDAELDSCEACDLISQGLKQTEEHTAPKKARGRTFDRAVIHMFELFYASVIERSNNPGKLRKSAPDFFTIVPRGECLDLFLQLIKCQCIGDDEVLVYSQKLEVLLEFYTDDGEVDWERVYVSSEFSSYRTGLFTIIFSHMKTGKFPVPALNNGMSAKHNPERINLLLKHMMTIWELQQTE